MAEGQASCERLPGHQRRAARGESASPDVDGGVVEEVEVAGFLVDGTGLELADFADPLAAADVGGHFADRIEIGSRADRLAQDLLQRRPCWRPPGTDLARAHDEWIDQQRAAFDQQDVWRFQVDVNAAHCMHLPDMPDDLGEADSNLLTGDAELDVDVQPIVNGTAEIA